MEKRELEGGEKGRGKMPYGVGKETGGAAERIWRKGNWRGERREEGRCRME